MHETTQSLHIRVAVDNARPSVTPLYQNSAFEAGSSFFYTRKNNPNIEEYEEVVRTLECAKHAVAVTTGMAALRVTLDLLRPGETVVMNTDLYGCSFKLIQRTVQHYGMKLVVLDLSTPEALDKIPAETRMVLFETPTNPWLKVIDIRRVADLVKSRNPEALIVVDNTWATPLHQHPLEFGADISLHSATKYFSGHSDVMGGILLTERTDLAEAFRASRFYSGFVLDPHSAWLLRRSLQTMPLRLERHRQSTDAMREFLPTLPQVVKVYYPEVDGKQLRAYGGIVFFDLRPDLIPHYPNLLKSLRLFSTGTGMACVTSMIAQPYSGSHASMTDAEKAAMGLGPGLVRLCFGLEEVADLQADLRRALSEIDPQNKT